MQLAGSYRPTIQLPPARWSICRAGRGGHDLPGDGSDRHPGTADLIPLGPLVNAGPIALGLPGRQPVHPGHARTRLPAVIPDPVATPRGTLAHPTNIDDHVKIRATRSPSSGGIGTVSALVLANHPENLMSIALELVQGTARDFPFQVTNPDGTVPTGIFLATDVLTASVWAGSNEVPLLTPTATWISATNAQYQVTLQNTDSSSLALRDLLPPGVRDPGRHAAQDDGAPAPGHLAGDHRGARGARSQADLHQHHRPAEDRPLDRRPAGAGLARGVRRPAARTHATGSTR